MTSDAVSWIYSLAPDVKVEPDAGGAVLRTPIARIRIEGRSECEMLGLLAGDGCSDVDVRRQLRSGDPAEGVETSFPALLYRLDRVGLLARALTSRGRRLVMCVPLRPPPGAMPDGPPPGLLRLSPRAFARADAGALSLELPGAWASLTIHHRDLLPLLHDLANDRTAVELAAVVAGCPEEAVRACLALMHWCGLLAGTEDDGWPNHDLLFHARTRAGYARRPLGKTGAGQTMDEPGMLATAATRARVALPRPDLQRLVHEDPPFALVSEQRQSVRRYGSLALTLDQLSELLFRTLHQRGERRPYPSGGSRYPLNAYLAVHRCGGLARGLYAYDPLGHVLIQVAEPAPSMDRLLVDAARAAAVEEPPQVLLVLAARFGRTRRMYGDLSYSLILKEVGAVFQAAMMAAAAMRLATCPLGCGNSLLFAELLGQDPLVEASVGEMMIGSPAMTA
jgi:SagB-type dehydrogenase family enzyme